MNKLPYLVAEINAALEVYISGRTGQQYNRTAYILCDDAAELASKLFLITDTPTWSDKRANGTFKNFVEFTTEVKAVFSAKRPTDHTAVTGLLDRVKARRTRRNEFFHATSLLDLNLHARDCVEAFCDVLDYGKLLFPTDWDSAVATSNDMETCEAIIRLDNKAYLDPRVIPKFNAVISSWPRGTSCLPKPRGCEVVSYAEDMHLRLAIRNGGDALRDKLRALL